MPAQPATLEVPAGVPAPGDVFAGKYRIEGVLGVGGMGAVLAARHLHLDERVAIKVMLPEVADDGATSVRFLREARAAVKIKSEHVAKVLDFGQLDGGQPYIVMEYLVGEDLAAALERRGRLPVRDTVDYLLQACEALGQAHALGIVHRDLKPGNLFLTTRDDGTPCVKVLDFGISKATTQDGSLASLTLTKTQSVVGSPMYMAPEQMRSNQALDARTDIWSLGVVAYELLTGRLPFDAQTMPELCAMVLQDPPPPLVRDDLPAGLGAAVFRCLEKKPADRFANLAALAAAIAPFGSPSAADLALRISRIRKPDGAASSAPTHSSSPLASTVAADGAFQVEAVAARTQPDPAAAVSSRPDARTAATWTGVTPALRPRRSRVPAALFGLAILGGGVVVTVRLVSNRSPVEPASTVAVGPAGSPAQAAQPEPAASPPNTGAPASAASPEPPLAASGSSGESPAPSLAAASPAAAPAPRPPPRTSPKPAGAPARKAPPASTPSAPASATSSPDPAGRASDRKG